VTHIVRFIDLASETDGVLVDMEYTNDNGQINFVDLRIHNIINGTVGQLVEAPIGIKLGFVMYLINFLENEQQ